MKNEMGWLQVAGWNGCVFRSAYSAPYMVEHPNLTCNQSLTRQHSLLHSFMQTFIKYLLGTGDANLNNIWFLPQGHSLGKETATNGWLQRPRLRSSLRSQSTGVPAAIMGMDASALGLCVDWQAEKGWNLQEHQLLGTENRVVEE